MPSPLTRRFAAGVVAGVAAAALVGTAAPAFAAVSTPPTASTTACAPSQTLTNPGQPKPVYRLSGCDRIGTAIAISQNLFPSSGTAGAVILTAEYDFPDAMSAGPLAKFLDAPVLLTAPGVLTPATLTEIQRVLPAPVAAGSTGLTVTHGCATTVPVETPGGATATTSTPAGSTVYIIGGRAALAPGIDKQLEDAGYNVVRIAGPNRFATSVAVAQCEGSPTNVFLATGDIFADALTAGPAAASVSGAVLLTDGTTMPPPVQTYLNGLSNPVVYAIGGSAAQADPQAKAIFGGDRFATSALVAEDFFKTPTVVGVATGYDFPDALAGGAAMGMKGGPVLMSDPRFLPSAIALYVTNTQATIGQGFLFGGTDVLSPAIASTLSNQINNNP
jgi:putative cell wall-binding protein